MQNKRKRNVIQVVTGTIVCLVPTPFATYLYNHPKKKPYLLFLSFVVLFTTSCHSINILI